MASTLTSEVVLVDPNQLGKAAAINTAIDALDKSINALLKIQADDGSHANPYTFPYQTGDEPVSPKGALRFALLEVAGALTGDWNGVFPTGPTKMFMAQNNTTGGHNIKLSTAAQVLPIAITPGVTKLLFLDGANVIDLQIGSGGAVTQPYDVYNFIDGRPTAGLVVTRFVAARTILFPANFSSNFMKADTAAAATSTFNVNKNGSLVGTAVFSAGGTTAVWSTVGGATVTLSAGDKLTITAPNPQDATLADLEWVMSGTR